MVVDIVFFQSGHYCIISAAILIATTLTGCQAKVTAAVLLAVANSCYRFNYSYVNSLTRQVACSALSGSTSGRRTNGRSQMNSLVLTPCWVRMCPTSCRDLSIHSKQYSKLSRRLKRCTKRHYLQQCGNGITPIDGALT